MQKVRILAVSVSVSSYHLLQLLALLVVLPPFPIVIGALGILQLVQQNLILIYYFRQTSDSVGSIQRTVRVQALRVRLLHLRNVEPFPLSGGYRTVDSLDTFYSFLDERGLEVNLQHFFEKNPVLILNLAEPLHFLEFFFIIIDDVRRLRRLLDIDYRSDVSEPLHMENMVLDLLPLCDQPI